MPDAALRPPPSHAYFRTVVGVLVLMTLLKMLWALESAGSVDMVLFFNFGKAIDHHGLTELYRMDEKFNHTPLTGGFAWLLYRIAGEDKMQFAFLLRLAGIVADGVVVAAFLRWREKLGARPPWWALIVFAASPVSLMISGFHGNVDPVMIALLFLASIAAARERPVLCGLLFGLASNVKIVPIVLSPVFLFFWLARPNSASGTLRFAATSGALMLAGWALPLVTCPREFIHNVFGYGSMWGVWGLPCLLRQTGWEEVQKIDFKDLTATQNFLAAILKYSAIGGIAAVGWLRRKAAPTEFAATIGFAWLVFFIFAPGVGVQYMVWAAPFLLLLNAPAYAVITAASSVFLFAFYQSCSGGRWPWFLAVPRGPEAPLWSAWGIPTWLSFCGVFIALTWRRATSNAENAAPVPA